MHHYYLHGLIVASETALSAAPCIDTCPTIAQIKLMPWQIDSDRFSELASTVIHAEKTLIHRDFLSEAGTVATTIRTVIAEQGWRTLFFDKVLYHWDATSGVLQRWVGQLEDLALGDALQSGSYWATLCTLLGRFPIHGSAVDLPDEGGTWLVVARSGHGKTSTAASLVLAGAKLRSDDVVTLSTSSDGQWLCEAGSLTLRMRKPLITAALAAERISSMPTLSGDGRTLYSCSTDIPHTAGLRGICFVVLDDQIEALHVSSMSRLDSFKALANDPRVVGVQNRNYHTQRVHHLSQICQRIPMFELRLPFSNRNLAQQGAEILTHLQKLGCETST